MKSFDQLENEDYTDDWGLFKKSLKIVKLLFFRKFLKKLVTQLLIFVITQHHIFFCV